MPLTDPFETYTDRYERWFETYDHAHRSEVAALRRLVPDEPDGVEIGVCTGRFAAPLNIAVGVDPSERMLRRAAGRGITTVRAVAEALPFKLATFDTALIVTTICFVDDIDRTVQEARHILRPGGRFVVGYIDRDSPVGCRYQRTKGGEPVL